MICEESEQAIITRFLLKARRNLPTLLALLRRNGGSDGCEAVLAVRDKAIAKYLRRAARARLNCATSVARRGFLKRLTEETEDTSISTSTTPI